MTRPCITDQLRMAALGPGHVTEDHAESPDGNLTRKVAIGNLTDAGEIERHAQIQAKTLAQAEGR